MFEVTVSLRIAGSSNGETIVKLFVVGGWMCRFAMGVAGGGGNKPGMEDEEDG